MKISDEFTMELAQYRLKNNGNTFWNELFIWIIYYACQKPPIGVAQLYPYFTVNFIRKFVDCSQKHVPKEKKVCILGDQHHMDEANANELT